MREILSLRQAISATFHYFDLFDWPLTLQEVEDYLYGWSAPESAIGATLAVMGEEMGHSNGFYCLAGREKICGLRKEREKIAHRLWRRANRFSWIFALCTFLKMAAVCNSCAYGNVKDTSDIDVFIVVENGKLATARFFLKVLTQIFGMRVHHDKIAGRFCLSFFVSEKATNLEPLAHEFDPHLAYFAWMMTPIYGEDEYLKFLKANEKWLGRYFRRISPPRLERLKKHPVASFFGIIIAGFLRIFGGTLEILCQKLQGKKDNERKKQFPHSAGGITMTKDVFKFHEDDPRQRIAEDFMKRLELIQYFLFLKR